VLTRVLVFVTAYFGMNLFSDYTSPSAYESVEWPGTFSQHMRLETNIWNTKVPLLEQFLTADTFAYVNMEDMGYDDFRMDEPHPPANWVFFPLFPLVLRLFTQLTSLDPVTAGLLASNLFLLIAIIFLYLIGVNRGLKDYEARIAVCLLLIAPASIFFAVPYTESLFLMLATGAVYYTLRGKWFPAFLLAGLCTVTRNVGVVIFAFTCCSLLLEKRLWKFHWRDWRLLFYFLIGCIPLASYLGYMKWLTGDFLAPIHEQLNWGRYTTLPFVSYVHYLTNPYFQTSSGWENGLISFVIATSVLLVFLGYLIYMLWNWRRLPNKGQQLLLFGAGVLLVVIPFSSGEHLASIPRYMTVCFPFYLYLVEMFRRHLTVVAGYALFAFLFHIVFINGYFNHYLFVF
jgi:Gpi18-like mannosyltransferase